MGKFNEKVLKIRLAKLNDQQQVLNVLNKVTLDLQKRDRSMGLSLESQ
ncbi:hypothetical protein DFO70_12543 [Cytobacillus firmus]|uniref:Uncharacterized protein n=2 Tax=Cytobacillus TaxID=2675230 RepID=A0A366JHV4_CYTFI|nr:hypothetical protein DFO70_12543 [Cytobacillus firmus]TDX39316.1 hypothetical protein DFO72_111147 [Cytobacillus oceanisediminis]